MSSENGIKINRNQRRWHKYGKLIIGLAIAAAAVIVIICIAAATSGGKKEQQVASTEPVETTVQQLTDENGNTIESESATQEAPETGALALSGKPEEAEFTEKSAFDNSVFVGDVFVNSLLQYELIDEYYIWTSNMFTTTKADSYVDDVAELKPEKVFIMFGFDDSASNTAQETVANYEKYLTDLKQALPDTKIFILSEMPVTKEFDEEPGDITQAVIDDVNKQMQDKASTLGVTYIDVATAFKSDTNLSDDYTSDGYHIKQAYYPFVLNGIAELIR